MKNERGMTYNDVHGLRRDPYEVARRRMVEQQLIPGGVKDERVLAAMRKVPRHMFVAEGMRDQSYLDRPLNIGMGQTISQPLMVGIMTEALQLSGSERVLEIGTGSGYQAAVLAEIAKDVYSIERIRELSISARKVFHKLNFKNIKLRIGDGTLGWPEEAPFDRIVVTAGAPVVPESLREQLEDGGLLVIPVGGQEVQNLEIIKRERDEFTTSIATACRFVKLIGEKGWQ